MRFEDPTQFPNLVTFGNMVQKDFDLNLDLEGLRATAVLCAFFLELEYPPQYMLVQDKQIWLAAKEEYAIISRLLADRNILETLYKESPS